MYPQNAFSTLDIRCRNHNLAVKSAGSQKCRIQNIRPVGCRNQDNSFIGFKTIHLHQQLIQGLFPFIMPTTQAGTTMTTHGINFINKNQARSIFLALVKEIAHSGCPDTHKHFDKIGTTDAEKGNFSLTCHRFGHQCFSGTRRTNQQDTFRYFTPKAGKSFRIPEEIDNFFQLRLGFFTAGNILKGKFFLVFRQQLGPTFTKRHGFATASLHLTHKENPDADKQQHGKPGDDKCLPYGGSIFGFSRDFNPFAA